MPAVIFRKIIARKGSRAEVALAFAQTGLADRKQKGRVDDQPGTGWLMGLEPTTLRTTI